MRWKHRERHISCRNKMVRIFINRHSVEKSFLVSKCFSSNLYVLKLSRKFFFPPRQTTVSSGKSKLQLRVRRFRKAHASLLPHLSLRSNLCFNHNLMYPSNDINYQSRYESKEQKESLTKQKLLGRQSRRSDLFHAESSAK